jgi:hypothetical protein
LDIDHGENPEEERKKRAHHTKNKRLGLPFQVISLESIMSLFCFMTLADWTPHEASIEEIRARFPAPLLALARGEVPAFVLRQIYPSEHCAALMRRFAERGLLYDPRQAGDGTPHRVDIGTSWNWNSIEKGSDHLY